MTGLILINKPKGITSFQAVARVRRLTGEKKCGHTGTLDPMAQGVMTVMLGGATRFCELLPDHDKAYRATVLLGTVTDTLDITGEVLATNKVNVTPDEFAAVLGEFVGEIEQVPPMYSAVSVNGQRLYDLARKGIEVERKARRVTVSEIKLVSCDGERGEYVIDVSCSAGTYIRTLAADIGERLGCGAVLTELIRTRANGFDISQTLTLEELEEKINTGDSSFLSKVEDALAAYPEITVSAAQAKRFSNGGELDLQRVKTDVTQGAARVYSPEKVFLGLGEVADGALLVKRVYNEK